MSFLLLRFVPLAFRQGCTWVRSCDHPKHWTVLLVRLLHVQGDISIYIILVRTKTGEKEG